MNKGIFKTCLDYAGSLFKDKDNYKKKEETISKSEETISKNTPKTEEFKTDYEKEFINVFNSLTQRYRAWDVWKDVITAIACSISNSINICQFPDREKIYMDSISRYETKEVDVFPKLLAYIVMALEENSDQDFLGSIFMRLQLGNSANGQFFTPYTACKLMASLTIENCEQKIIKDGYITINDCACGAGATLIAGIHEVKDQLKNSHLNFQNHVLIVAQDIDYIVAMMCYIQISLLGVAGFVKVGNTLTEPISKTDNYENYWFTPMYFSNDWRMRRAFHKL